MTCQSQIGHKCDTSAFFDLEVNRMTKNEKIGICMDLI